ncbi:MAG: choice-of-anchor A family protein [Lachnospiraceae bacterium]|nr:choice-of-anchor A family protein [Lachnospiraceae bacterium]
MSGGKLKLDGGNTYELTAAQLAKLGDNGIYFNDGYSGDPVVIVVKDEKSVTIPKCDFAYMVDSTNRIDFYTEAMVNLNIVWVLPDAENVSALELTGHIVAPKATVTLTGGQFEGCIIAKTLNASGTEGHHWTLGRSLPSIPSVTVQPVVKKVVTGTNAPDDDVFTFTIKAGEKTELPDYYNKSATAKAGEEAKFDEITYYEEGKFTYIITEDTPREKTPGMEYSDEVITMTVNVTKNGSKLDVNVTYSNDDISNDFPQNVITNHYYKTTAQPVVKKVVTGSGAPDDEVYTFSIKATGDTKLPTDYKTKVTAKDGEEAKFDEITYYEEGTYTYEIKEEAPDTKIFGMQYSEEVVKVTVEVKKNLETDELEAEITYTNPDATGTDKNVITNNFAITDYDIWVQKIVISVTYGVDAPDNKQFTFELTAHPDTPDAPLPSDAVNGAMEITVTDNAVDHFGRIYYTEAGEYKYIIKELVPRDAATNYFGFAFDDTEHVITVKVEENDKKELVVTSVTGVKDIDYKGEKVPGVSFTNEYDPVVDLEVELTKFVTGPARTSDKPAVFTFTMKAEGDAPMPASAQNGEVTITMTDSQVARFTEVISFPAMTYIEATHPGQIWVYTVTENVGSDDGFTYDEKEYRVEVTVDKATNNPYFLETFVKLFEVDNSGATPRFTPVREITFTNTYTEEEESSGGGESSSTPGGEESSGGGESSSTPGGDSSGSSESSSTSGGGGSSSGSGSSGKDGPQTGDNSSVTLWVILMMLSCAGIYIVSFIRKMKRFEGQ